MNRFPKQSGTVMHQLRCDGDGQSRQPLSRPGDRSRPLRRADGRLRRPLIRGTSGVTMAWLRLKLPMLVALASICTVGTFFGSSASASPRTTLAAVPRFEPAPCPFTPAADQVGLTVRCGFVVVPEDRTRPDQTWIRLAVAIFKSPVVATRPPLIFLGGGPGSFVLGAYEIIVCDNNSTDATSAVAGPHAHRENFNTHVRLSYGPNPRLKDYSPLPAHALDRVIVRSHHGPAAAQIIDFFHE